ncbi:ChaN family lipoprotein [Bdellovibrio sp. 22V]|uniref:ChaN family lipoprotein n=1 Tax=Bdellovibrio TaxID=958 RepID=UPI002543814E|nr:ChaN family lipoprotein [Bdellovibrio sp. 22V]WII73797.1 ChaN family lipoprotein [Bdellovibrio sp. 22V]
MNSLSLFLVSVLLSACAHAQSTGILRGNDHQAVTLEDSVSSVQPGSIIVIGENHGFKEHQNQQVAIMQALRARGLKVSVGMEFFTYTQQSLVDSYRQGSLTEADFLKAVQWGSPSYDYYRDQAVFPNLAEGSATLALNAPRGLTGKVAKQGLSSLTPEENRLLPPQFSLGRDSYKQRFLGMMPHLPSPEAGERYFAAQSIWDDTMAWRATDFITAHPEQVLVIVVGEFHVQFGGGLPDRLRARAPQVPVLTFSQVNTDGLSEDEISQEIAPSLSEGPRADFLWLAPAKSLGL